MSRFWRGLAAMLTLWAVSLSACGTATRAVIDDAAITARIKTVLLNDAGVSGTRIDVDTLAGIVTLSGTVTSATDVERAVQLVRGVTGVRDVKSTIEIAPERR